MVQILAGEKGEGKTKILIDLANESVSTSDGDVIYIDDDKRHIYDLNHKIRFVEVSEFPLANYRELIGFMVFSPRIATSQRYLLMASSRLFSL